MSLLAPLGTDWFTYFFWLIRKGRLGPGNGFAAATVRVERGHTAPSPLDRRTIAENLGDPRHLHLRHGSGRDPLAPLPFGLVTANRLTALLPVYDLGARWASADEARSELRAAFGSPAEASWSDVHDDSVLTRLATAGMGAHLLRARSGGGYEIDLLHLSRYSVRAPFERYGARLLLSADLAPEAIERDGQTARPGDAPWERFVLAFEATLAAWTTLVDHSLSVHFAMAGSFVLALRLGLVAGHPLRDVLTPASFATTAVNSSGVFSLVADQAYFARIFAFDYEGLRALLTDAVAEIRWQTFPELLEAQGLAAPLASGAPLPFAADALLWWNAIDRFVAAVLDRWARPDDPEPARFAAIWADLLPEARFDSVGHAAALRRMLSVTLFSVTVMHEQVGDMVWYIQDPTWMPVKIRPGTAADQLLFKQDAVQKMILGALTGGVEMPRVLDPLSPGFPDPEMDRVWAAFQADLRAVGAEIASRNATRARPYPGLAPERIHLSVSL